MIKTTQSISIRACKLLFKTTSTSYLIFLLCITSESISAQLPLPTGNSGIAKNYPGDIGIGSDPAVIFFDDFESYKNVSELITPGRWNNSFQNSNIKIASQAGTFFDGKNGLEFNSPKSNNEISNALVKDIPGEDVLFLRYYAKIDNSFNVTGSSHNGFGMAASYWSGPGSGPGIKADGYNKFLVAYEAWRGDTTISNPGELNVYVYHPEQRDIWGDHLFPTGIVLPWTYLPGNYGPSFIKRPNVIPILGQWYCHELMVKANTPGQRDGRIAMWLDGELIADFMNIRLRDTLALKIDQFDISLHIYNNKIATKKWCDNVVAARSYIGPLFRNTTHVEPVVRNNKLLVYPNPFTESFTLDLTGINRKVTDKLNFHLYNILGEQVLVLNNISDNVVSIRNKFETGIYFYTIRLNSERLCSGKLGVE
ncbi:MAG: T9SS type A sorting domain-containing protein [Saprospiraceae bacterium]|nr:T9SS type A sorting domain-containing protein [Saprospiraceae bacterium]